MAPPDRSRRKRHGKSPRNKRFGSGKSTPSSPAGTPTRHPHTPRASNLAGGTSRDSSCHESGAEALQPSESHSSSISTPLEVISNDCVPGTGDENFSCLKEVDEESSSSKIRVENNLTTMSGEGHKLDRLSGLLDKLAFEHNAHMPQNVKVKDSPTKNPVVQNAQKVDVSAVTDSPAVKPNEDKSRDEVELERNARKEAKKANKKGGNKENEKDGAKGANVNKSEGVGKSSQDSQKVQKSPMAVAGNQNEGATPKVSSESKAEEVEASGKSKADLKRERREKQEAQRKAKMEEKAQQEEGKKQKPQQAQQGGKDKAAAHQPKKKEIEGKKGRDKKIAEKEQHERRIPLLGHLTPYSSQIPPSLPVNSDVIHPAIRTLGIKMKERVIDGSTARVISMLAAFKRVISDYQTPESSDLYRDLAEKLVSNMSFLRACRPQNVAMDNAIRFLKHEVHSIGPGAPETQAKDELGASIDEYIKENIVLASSTIASHAAQVIKDGDVILTFGYSALVCDVVEAASTRGEKVSVVVADTPHPPSGAAMAKRLADLGITTYYRLMTEVLHIMNKVTKVIVEAESVMMNGAVQGLCGTAGLALAAAIHDTPFIVLCHTYKFCNNDLTDSLVLNELGDADSVVSCPGEYSNLLADWRETPNLNVVSLVYDVTPANLVTALITEQNVLPTSAVPVIIRRNYADILGQD